MTKLRKIICGAPTQDRAGELALAIKALCYEKADGLSLAAVIGVLEIVKIELLGEA